MQDKSQKPSSDVQQVVSGLGLLALHRRDIQEHHVLQASSLNGGSVLQETAFQDPAEHSHDLSAQKLLQQGRQTTPSDLAKLSQDMHTGSELEQSKEQNDEQQAAVTRYTAQETRTVRGCEFRGLHYPHDSIHHQDLQHIGNCVQ